ncbi:hypothetical protein SCL_1608 [Sulfuricaulis limicola]|uniref:Right handed beta helix domain-containing protein n=1 Tax=Sulfuricaulis limicola TaxID=1620215 RepID=A0A1B4XGK9_9GAMM|nr:right-handed parallel beta-helix repeat-containing protein [Sulfuricaulis limicola]BAV33913.1 hypothetical protein SCL_1608 [Sulfuricaulis limicola]
MRQILVGSSALWLALASICFGADYYFDATSGNDNGTGTSPDNPWKTEAKFNATSFYPGDNIYFKRGETWDRDALYLHNSGKKDNVITLTAYGTGKYPVLLRIVSGARRGAADFWTIKNVIVTNRDGWACIDIVGYAANLTIQDSVIHRCAGRGISVTSLIAGDTDNLLIQDVTVRNNGQQGIHVSDSTGLNPIRGVVVQRVTAFGNGTDGPNNLDGITVGGLAGGVVQYCKSHGNNGDGIDLGGASTDSVVRYNLAYNNTGTGIVVSNTANNTLVIGNVAHHNATGMHIKKPTSDTTVYNNTLVYNSDYGAQLSSTNTVTFKNNIVAHNMYGAWHPILFTRASGQKLVSDHNLFWHPVHSASEFYDHNNRIHYSFARWRTQGYDIHSVNADPDLDANYAPNSNSPAIGAGANLGAPYAAILNPAASWTGNVSTLDQDNSGPWDIGAYRHRN